jgi:hypothetical protein
LESQRVIVEYHIRGYILNLAGISQYCTDCTATNPPTVAAVVEAKATDDACNVSATPPAAKKACIVPIPGTTVPKVDIAAGIIAPAVSPSAGTAATPAAAQARTTTRVGKKAVTFIITIKSDPAGVRCGAEKGVPW